jgi:hypothetical protein
MKVWDPQAIGLQIYKVNGIEAKLRCPFHFDKTPSAMFNLQNGLFHCFGCGYSSNVYEIVREFGGELSKVELSVIPHHEEENREWRVLTYSKLAYSSKYLAKREVTPEQIELFHIMKHKEGILFPVFDMKENIIGIQERRFSLDPKYFLHGQRTPVWPMTNLRFENLLLVEGVFGVLRAQRLGYNAVCTMGASAIPQAAKVLEGHNVKIVFDDDLAGYLGAYSFMRLHKTSSVVLPGMEVDEADKLSLSRVFGEIPTRDVMGYAIKIGDKRLVDAIRLKEEQHEKKKGWANTRFTSRTVSRSRLR